MARDPDEDDALFAAAVAGVVPLEQTRLAPTPVYRDPVPLSEREREVIRELDALVNGESPFDLRNSDEFLSGCVPGLDPRVLRRLRKGEFTPQADLDLHGCDAATARGLVEEFVVAAHAREPARPALPAHRARPRPPLAQRRAGAASQPAALARARPRALDRPGLHQRAAHRRRHRRHLRAPAPGAGAMIPP